MTSSKAVAYIEAVLAATAWGASFIATKVALRDISPITIVWMRFAIGLLILGFMVSIRKQFALPAKSDWKYFALLGFLGITFHQWLQSNGLQTSEAGTTAWIVASTPVFMALLGWLALHEKLNARKAIGIVLAFVGVLLVASRGDIASISVGRFGAPGDVLILMSAINWSIVSTLSRRGLNLYPAGLFTFYMMAFGLVFSSILFVSGGYYNEIFSPTLDGWMGVGFLGIFCSGLAYIWWYDALQSLTTVETGVFLYIEPLVAMLVAFVVLGESITIASVIGGGIILVGVWLVNKT
jgi:drug/metabolite transporter (DMT)-like permease